MRVAVVGAGVVGASVAFHLAKHGVEVGLYDAGPPAGGASGRSGALVRMHYTFLPDAALAKASLDEFMAWPSVVGGESGFRRTGFLRIVARELEDKLRQTVSGLQGLGVKTHVVDARDIAEIDPRLRVSESEVAAYEPDSGYGDPHTMVEAYSSHPNVHTNFYQRVTDVARAGGLWRVQTVAAPAKDYDALVLACAFGAAELLAKHNITLPLYRRSHVVCFVESTVNRERPHVTCIDGPMGLYFRPEGAALTLCGPQVMAEEEGQESVPDAARERALHALSQRIPDTRSAEWHSGYIAQDTHTPDGHAAIGPVADGLFVAAGFSGTGFKTSPAVGDLVAKWVVTGSEPPALSPYSPDRFAAGTLIRDENSYADRYYDVGFRRN